MLVLYTLRVLTKGCGDFPDIIGGNSCYFFHIYIDRYHDWLSNSITHNWNFNPSLLLKAKETQLCHKLNSKSHPAGHKDDKRTHCSEVETFTADLLWQFRCLCLGIHAFRIVDICLREVGTIHRYIGTMYSIAILASPHMVCMQAATAFSTDRDFYDGDLVILIGLLVCSTKRAHTDSV